MPSGDCVWQPSTFTTPDITTCIIAPPGLNAREYEAFRRNLHESLAQSAGRYLILQAGSEVKQICATSTEIIVDVWSESTLSINNYRDWDDIGELIDLMFQAEGKLKDPAWVMTKRTKWLLGMRQDANGEYFIDRQGWGAQKLFGLPIVIDNNISDNTVYLCEIIARTNASPPPSQGFVKCPGCVEYQRPTPSGRCPGCGAGLVGV